MLSVDLASRRFRDNGIALLASVGDRVSASTVDPAQLGLHDPPDANSYAAVLCALAEDHGVELIVLDGPQAWRADSNPAVQRVCERLTRTPGKTGAPGCVLPASWTRMAVFSVQLFDALASREWPRFASTWHGARATVESFPTHAWRTLGRPPLPGKRNGVDLHPWKRWLEQNWLVDELARPTHDELQAIVAGLAGIQLITVGREACDIRGVDPTVERGSWREGFIVSPRPKRS